MHRALDCRRVCVNRPRLSNYWQQTRDKEEKLHLATGQEEVASLSSAYMSTPFSKRPTYMNQWPDAVYTNPNPAAEEQNDCNADRKCVTLAKKKHIRLVWQKKTFGMPEWIIVKSGEAKIIPTIEHIKAAFFSVKWWEVSSSHPIIKVPEYLQMPGLGEGRLNFNTNAEQVWTWAWEHIFTGGVLHADVCTCS